MFEMVDHGSIDLIGTICYYDVADVAVVQSHSCVAHFPQIWGDVLVVLLTAAGLSY